MIWFRIKIIGLKLVKYVLPHILIASMTTIRYWINKFKHGRTSLLDEESPDRTIEVTTDDMVNKIVFISYWQTVK